MCHWVRGSDLDGDTRGGFQWTTTRHGYLVLELCLTFEIFSTVRQPRKRWFPHRFRRSLRWIGFFFYSVGTNLILKCNHSMCFLIDLLKNDAKKISAVFRSQKQKLCKEWWIWFKKFNVFKSTEFVVGVLETHVKLELPW